MLDWLHVLQAEKASTSRGVATFNELICLEKLFAVSLNSRTGWSRCFRLAILTASRGKIQAAVSDLALILCVGICAMMAHRLFATILTLVVLVDCAILPRTLL